jgi:arylformamidase
LLEETVVFNIDLNRYRIIDISYEVVPPGTEERPFVVSRGLLADDAFKYDVAKTHTHVGTHVESPAHFFEDGKSITDLPITQFFGRGILCPIKLGPDGVITAEYLQETIGDIVKPGDTMISRNDNPPKAGEKSPRFSHEAAVWMRDHGIKGLVLGDNIGMGHDIPETRDFHDVLQRADFCFIEFLSNLEAITQREFFFMALPFKVKGMDSGWARAIVIEEI